MTATKVTHRPGIDAQYEADLDRRYGAIGISALAAALRYQSATTNPGYARIDQRAKRQDAENAG